MITHLHPVPYATIRIELGYPRRSAHRLLPVRRSPDGRVAKHCIMKREENSCSCGSLDSIMAMLVHMRLTSAVIYVDTLIAGAVNPDQLNQALNIQ